MIQGCRIKGREWPQLSIRRISSVEDFPKDEILYTLLILSSVSQQLSITLHQVFFIDPVFRVVRDRIHGKICHDVVDEVSVAV